MKILKIIHGYPPLFNAGSEVYSRMLVHGLINKNHQVAVFTRFENPFIQDYEIQLKKGDWLILYTDGFVEAMDSSRSDYGEERLLKMIRENKDLKAKELIKAICHDVTLFSKNHPQYDDMTMVAIKVL